MNCLKIFVPLFVLIVSLPAEPNDTLQLTLDESIAIARRQSPSHHIALNLYESKKAQYRGFRAGLYPQLSLSGESPGFFRSISSVTLPDGTTIFTPQSQALSTMQLRLLQKIPWTGGEISVGSSLNRIDILDSKSATYRATPFSVIFRQPLFQLNSFAWDEKSEELLRTIAEREFAESSEDIAMEITTKYFDAYIGRLNVENSALNLAINDTLYQISKGRYNVGKIAENDLLQNELAFMNAQTQLENSELQYGQALKNLKFALGIPYDHPILLLFPQPHPGFQIDSAKASSEAKKNRSERKQYELEKLTAERNVAQARMSNDFSATITASAGFNQSAPELKGAYNNLLDQQQFSINFEIPLLQWGKGSAMLESALAQERRTDASLVINEQAFEQGVLYEIIRFHQLQRQVILSAKADTIAQRRFDVSKERYLVGKIDIPNLFLAQSEKDNARRTYTQTLRDYWMSYFRVRRLTLFDFEKNIRIGWDQTVSEN